MILYPPQVCAGNTIRLQNTGSRPKRLWLQKRVGTQLQEEEFLLAAQIETVVDIKDQPKETLYSISTESIDPDLVVHYQCDNISYDFEYTADAELIYKVKNKQDFKLSARNIYKSLTLVNVEFLDSKHKTLEEQNFEIQGHTQNVLEIKSEALYSYIRIKSHEKTSLFLVSNYEILHPFIIQPKTTSIDSRAKYYLVSPKVVTPTTDQYIVQITDPQMIQKAQQQIDQPHLEKIIFASLKEGSNGFNRNLNSKEKSLWTWSIGEVTNISDLASTACNGAPQFVEDYLTQWLNDPGKICFWNYRIIREVTPEEVSTGINPYFP